MTIFLIYFLLFPQRVFEASKNGLLLWFEQILPTLLPFSILSNLLLSSGILPTSPEENSARAYVGGSVILCGFLFGFPIGSLLSASCYKKKLLSQRDAQILCGFCNNMGPSFVISYVIYQQLNLPDEKLPMLFLLYGVPLVLGSLRLFCQRGNSGKIPKLPQEDRGILAKDFSFGRRHRFPSNKKKTSRFQLNMKIIDAGIISSFETLIKICGYIVLFSIVSSIVLCLNFPWNLMKLILVGNLEVTNGIAYLAALPLCWQQKFFFANGFLALGGLSGMAQTASMISGSHLSFRQYVVDRFLYGSLTMALTICYLLFF